MDELRFEWDEAKNRENQRKHRVSFEEAQTVFYDDLAILRLKTRSQTSQRSDSCFSG